MVRSFYQNKDKAGYDAFLTSKGAGPGGIPRLELPGSCRDGGGVLEAMKAFHPRSGRNRSREAAQLKADLDAGRH